jgi:uncharacterized protein YdhG (YjbR/CyaY superfamily)
MQQKKQEYTSIDEYIRLFPEHTRKKLREMREVIREQAPQAQERISYRMPAFFLNGNLVYFAAYAKHIGFYPTASGIRAFKSNLSKYKYAKGSVQFPLEEPLPIKLIKKIVKFRIEENVKQKKR